MPQVTSVRFRGATRPRAWRGETSRAVVVIWATFLFTPFNLELRGQLQEQRGELPDTLGSHSPALTLPHFLPFALPLPRLPPPLGFWEPSESRVEASSLVFVKCFCVRILGTRTFWSVATGVKVRKRNAHRTPSLIHAAYPHGPSTPAGTPPRVTDPMPPSYTYSSWDLNTSFVSLYVLLTLTFSKSSGHCPWGVSFNSGLPGVSSRLDSGDVSWARTRLTEAGHAGPLQLVCPFPVM